MSRAQLTVYMVIAILLIAVAAIVVLTKNAPEIIVNTTLPSQSDAVRIFMESCTKKMLEKNIYLFNQMGLPFAEDTYQIDPPVAVLYAAGSTLANISVFEERFSFLVGDSVFDCAFQAKQEYQLQVNDPTVEVTFGESGTTIVVALPVIIMSQKREEFMARYTLTDPFVFYPIYSFLKNLDLIYRQDLTRIPVSTILDAPYNTEISPIDNETVMVTILRPGYPYRFVMRVVSDTVLEVEK